MPSIDRTIRIYQELADQEDRRGQAQMRDRFLVLAADAALSAGRTDEAERLRLRLLQQNPHHLLKPYRTLAEAMKSPDVQDYVADLRRRYFPENAAQMLETMRNNGTRPAAGSQPPPPAERPAGTPPARVAEPKDTYEVQEPERKLPAAPPKPSPSAPAREAAPVSKPRPSATVSRPAPPAKPGRPAAPAPLRATGPSQSRKNSPSPVTDEESLAAGSWVATSLFWLLLLAGLGFTGFVVLRPFLPLG